MMYTEPSKELEDSRLMYPINFNYYHLGTAISNSLTKETINSWSEGAKETINSLSEGAKTIAETSNEIFNRVTKDLVHAPLENFLKTWYYIPITVWWTTFAPPMFSAVGKFACEAKKWTDKPQFGLLGLSACGPFLSMIKTLADGTHSSLLQNPIDKIVREYLPHNQNLSNSKHQTPA
ncbi:MAG: hypothetical protein MZV65_15435 [Chromatiales bacterium]|nr:hypothetical protein [Chromatiales bacterium]